MLNANAVFRAQSFYIVFMYLVEIWKSYVEPKHPLILPHLVFYPKFSVPQIEYPLGGSSKKGSHVYLLLQVFWVILLFCQIVLLPDINVVLMSQ